jgi:hypothetical protein
VGKWAVYRTTADGEEQVESVRELVTDGGNKWGLSKRECGWSRDTS